MLCFHSSLLFVTSYLQELQSTKSDIAKLQSLLSIRETDLQKLQDAMNGLTKLGETHTNNQFSLGLELERAKRDLARCQSELDARRREMDENDEEARERDSRMASLVSSFYSTLSQY